jgi:hypothetical protein
MKAVLFEECLSIIAQRMVASVLDGMGAFNKFVGLHWPIQLILWKYSIPACYHFVHFASSDSWIMLYLLNYITLTSLGELKGGILLDCRLNFGASGA